MLLKIRTLLPLSMTLNFLFKKMHNHFCEAITHFMIKCSFSFLWFQCHYHYPSFPRHHSYQTKWLHYIFRWINSGMPSSFFAHVVSFTQNGPSSCSPANSWIHLWCSSDSALLSWSLHLPLQQMQQLLLWVLKAI